jgi:hypothetical protein
MRAIGIILAGGNNNRMRELSNKRAIAAMPIAGSYRSIVGRFIGSENEQQIKYFVRNGQYEPTQMPANYDSVDGCLKEISNAFFWNKPAIINTHRLNYVGVYDQKTKDENIKNFRVLVKSIIKKWPNVEFMDSAELANLMLEE